MIEFCPNNNIWANEWVKVPINIESYHKQVLRMEVHAWATQFESEGYFWLSQYHVGFSNEEDAMIFTLKWVKEDIKW